MARPERTALLATPQSASARSTVTCTTPRSARGVTSEADVLLAVEHLAVGVERQERRTVDDLDARRHDDVEPVGGRCSGHSPQWQRPAVGVDRRQHGQPEPHDRPGRPSTPVGRGVRCPRTGSLAGRWRIGLRGDGAARCGPDAGRHREVAVVPPADPDRRDLDPHAGPVPVHPAQHEVRDAGERVGEAVGRRLQVAGAGGDEVAIADGGQPLDHHGGGMGVARAGGVRERQGDLRVASSARSALSGYVRPVATSTVRPVVPR